MPVRRTMAIDEPLLEKARRVCGEKTKTKVVQRVVEALIRQQSRRGILQLEGEIRWQGSLARMRKQNRLDPGRSGK